MQHFFQEVIRRKVLPLTGHAYEDRGVPFVTSSEILEEIIQVLPDKALRNVLGNTAPEMAKLLPDLRRVFPGIPDATELPPEQQQRFLFDDRGDWRTDIGQASLDVPDSVRLVTGRRIARLSEETQDMLNVAAVMGLRFRVPVLEAAIDNEVLDGIEEAEAAHLLKRSAGGPSCATSLFMHWHNIRCSIHCPHCGSKNCTCRSPTRSSRPRAGTQSDGPPTSPVTSWRPAPRRIRTGQWAG